PNVSCPSRSGRNSSWTLWPSSRGECHREIRGRTVIVTDIEHDALAELFNVGLHRAAASLSEITEQRILLDPPRLVVCPINEIETRLADLVGGEIATVHQLFGGAVAGDAVLLIEADKAALLAKKMT